MKLNIANPTCTLQKIVEVDDEKKLLPFFEKRMGGEVPGDSIGDEFKGYIFRISGGNDKQGFPMLQGVLVNHRVRLLLRGGMKCFRPRRKGQRKRKSVRGCIVGPDLSVLNLVLVKKGPEEIPGLTDSEKPRRLGPKRASRIRKLFNLDKEDDVRKYVVRRKIEGRNKWKAPKIQRLITPRRIQRKKKWKEEKRQRRIRSIAGTKEYAELIENYRKEMNEKRVAEEEKKEAKRKKKEKKTGGKVAKGKGKGKPPLKKPRKDRCKGKERIKRRKFRKRLNEAATTTTTNATATTTANATTTTPASVTEKPQKTKTTKK